MQHAVIGPSRHARPLQCMHRCPILLLAEHTFIHHHGMYRLQAQIARSRAFVCAHARRCLAAGHALRQHAHMCITLPPYIGGCRHTNVGTHRGLHPTGFGRSRRGFGGLVTAGVVCPLPYVCDGLPLALAPEGHTWIALGHAGCFRQHTRRLTCPPPPSASHRHTITHTHTYTHIRALRSSHCVSCNQQRVSHAGLPWQGHPAGSAGCAHGKTHRPAAWACKRATRYATCSCRAAAEARRGGLFRQSRRPFFHFAAGPWTQPVGRPLSDPPPDARMMDDGVRPACCCHNGVC